MKSTFAINFYYKLKEISAIILRLIIKLIQPHWSIVAELNSSNHQPVNSEVPFNALGGDKLTFEELYVSLRPLSLLLGG